MMEIDLNMSLNDSTFISNVFYQLIFQDKDIMYSAFTIWTHNPDLKGCFNQIT